MLLHGFLLLYINSDHQRRLWTTSVLNTHTLCSSTVSLSIKHVVEHHWLSQAGCDHLWREEPALGWCSNMNMCVYMCMCLQESGDDVTICCFNYLFFFFQVHYGMVLVTVTIAAPATLILVLCSVLPITIIYLIYKCGKGKKSLNIVFILMYFGDLI